MVHRIAAATVESSISNTILSGYHTALSIARAQAPGGIAAESRIISVWINAREYDGGNSRWVPLSIHSQSCSWSFARVPFRLRLRHASICGISMSGCLLLVHMVSACVIS